ncbi:LRR receptor-like serine/threonine-protein kinase FLS2-like protein [Corchorus olitorius]|uniref:LRR receptor-like serine/threonine-protein kinase FLS2-like protein n=1 Tax=Corchorus olitorius TaxID=93759 RepID=A0A1R3HJI0_9ROSI|nr:LRR receptor-like serine/threonine-protein kinase FLS2-like protein [Corchorus olitorius]
MEIFKGVGLVFALLCVITSEYACSGDSHMVDFSESLEAGALLGCGGNDLNDQQTRLSSCQCGSNSNEATLVNSEISSSFGFWDLIGDNISPSLLKFKYLQCSDSSLNTLIELDYFELSQSYLVGGIILENANMLR